MRILSLLLFVTAVLAQADPSGPPAVTDVLSALRRNRVEGSNNLLARSIESLLTDVSTLTKAIAATWQDLKISLHDIDHAERRYSYGGSPPVYPSPRGSGEGNWTNAYSAAKAMVAKMTDAEKARVALGTSTKGCSGFSAGVEHLGYPGMCLNDAESGVRTGKLVSGYPAQLHVGASWNRDLANARARSLGKEFKAKGVNVFLGPVVGPLGRIAKGGRNWEGFSNDPYLAGELVGPTISGIQESVIACVKHFIGNEQETNRNPFLQGFIPGFGNQSVSSNIDDRTLHEAYLWPFYDAIKAEPGAVMCSYNKVHGSYACQNSKLLNGLLKTELGFQGFVVSDWYAAHTGTAALNAGLDMVMPHSEFLSESKLADAVRNESVDSTRLDDMATRILAAWYRYAKIHTPGLDHHESIDARDPADDHVRFQSAVEGHVLVKNVDNALPLNKPKRLSLFGYDAVGGMNTTQDNKLLWEFAEANTETYPDGSRFTGLEAYTLFASVLPMDSAGPPLAMNGTMISGAGSGGITPTFSISPYDAFKLQSDQDGTTLHADFTSLSPSVPYPDSPCVVCINAASSESYDRSSLSDVDSDTLVNSVADRCSKTIVVVHNAGTVVVDAWINHANVSAVILAHLPGEMSGLALTELIYGRQSPSGRLPYTVAKAESDWGALLNATYATADDPFYSQSNFSEGLLIDYKSFVDRNIQPRFAFGHGLTYTTFEYSDFMVMKHPMMERDETIQTSMSAPPQGGMASLYEVLLYGMVRVKNTGKVAAAEVAQLYISIPGSGLPKVLRGFQKKLLQPGESAMLNFPLRRRDLSYWDTGMGMWMLGKGTFTAYVGRSVLEIEGHETFEEYFTATGNTGLRIHGHTRSYHLRAMRILLALFLCTLALASNDRADRYIVGVRADADLNESVRHARTLQKTSAASCHSQYDSITHQYDSAAFIGFAGDFSAQTVERLRNSANVTSIEKSQTWRAASLLQQYDAGYGLGLISHRTARTNSYVYEPEAGEGTYGYILDSGINLEHVDFQGRAVLGHNAVKSRPHRDVYGHGTHVAGIVGGDRFGVAKLCTLISVKISQFELTDTSVLLEGYNWAVDDIIRKHRQAKAVVNVSFHGGMSATWEEAVERAFRRGVTTVAAAGNDDRKASQSAPGGSLACITVAATDQFRQRASFSNWGMGVTMFAPGVEILSNWSGSPYARKTTSGTSQAAAYVTGIVLYQKSIRQLLDARRTMTFIMKLAISGAVKDPKASMNLFAYNGSGR